MTKVRPNLRTIEQDLSHERALVQARAFGYRILESIKYVIEAGVNKGKFRYRAKIRFVLKDGRVAEVRCHSRVDSNEAQHRCFVALAKALEREDEGFPIRANEQIRWSIVKH